MIEVPIVMLGGYSRKFPRRQCNIQLSRDNLEEQKLLESAFSGFQRAQNPKFWQHGATSGIYWVCYKPPVLSYSEVGTSVEVRYH